MSNNDQFELPRRTVLGGVAGLAATQAVSGGTARTVDANAVRDGVTDEEANGEANQNASAGVSLDDGAAGLVVEVTQPTGKAVNWVLPGPRRLSEKVFGTPDNPMMGDDLIKHVKNQEPEKAKLLDKLPFPVGVPVEMRETNQNDTAFTKTTKKTPFSDEHEPVKGELDLVYEDRQPWPKFKAANDCVELDVWFEDPEGNTYKVAVERLNDEMAGGIMANGFHHGTTGIGTPLMPKTYTYGAFWGVGTLTINDGEIKKEKRQVHFMTTQMVRDREYKLAIDEEMPLDEPFLGRSHHTHGILPAVKVTEKGLRYDPLDIPFPSNKQEGQEFIHIMFDQDEVSMKLD